MIGGGAYGARLARHFQLEESQTLLAHTASGHPLAVTRLRSDSNEPRVTTPLEVEQAFIVVLQMRDLLDHALSLRSGPVTVDPLPAGTTIMVDLALEPYARLGGPFDSLNFYIPRVALDEVAAEQGARSIEDLSVCPGRALRDDVVKHLGASLLPALENPSEASQLFVDHVSLALVSHLAAMYGGARAAPRLMRGRLAPWQERRAKEVMQAELSGSCSLATVARECGLSTSYFARAFRQTTGEPPHRWLLKARVAEAKRLLLDSSVTLAQIATACGFAEQSHFNRTFTRFAGTSPGAWRRAHAGGRA